MTATPVVGRDSYWPADRSVPVLDVAVGDLLRDAAADAPDKLALASVAPGRDAREWTYAQLLDDAERAAAWLSARFAPGDRIAVWAPNVPEWVILQYGVALAGMVLVTANPALRGPELRHVLTASESAGVFYVGDFRGTDMAALLEDVLPAVQGIRHAVRFEEWLPDVRATGRSSELPDVDPASPTQIQFTSGTTGPAKPAVLRHRAMVTNAVYVRERCALPYGATFATALPLFHTAGCGLVVMGSIRQRATFVIAELFDPQTILAALQDYRVKGFGGVPAMLHGLIAQPMFADYDLTALDIVMSGGDLVPPALVEKWRSACGVRASAVYGQTELSPVVCQTIPSDPPADNLFTAGPPLPNVEVAIVDPVDGTLVPLGVEGEICARGYQVMQGYLNLPDETARTVDAQGWLHTGDLGTMDARGYVTVTGRLKNLIIRGGENIHPAEVESVLLDHPAVAAVSVLGLPDEQWGESIAAVVQLASGEPRPSVDELRGFARERLNPQKLPTAWFVAETMPVNAMGKLQRFRLRDAIDGGGLTPL